MTDNSNTQPDDLNAEPTYSELLKPPTAPPTARRTRPRATGAISGGFGPFDTERRMPPTEYGGSGRRESGSPFA